MRLSICLPPKTWCSGCLYSSIGRAELGASGCSMTVNSPSHFAPSTTSFCTAALVVRVCLTSLRLSGFNNENHLPVHDLDIPTHLLDVTVEHLHHFGPSPGLPGPD